MSYVGGVITPDVAMKDKDEGNNEAVISASRSPQRWSYSSGIELDMTTFNVEDTSGFATDGVGTTRVDSCIKEISWSSMDATFSAPV